MEEIIIKEMVTALLNQFTTPIFTKLKKIGSDTSSKLKVALNLSFTEYLSRSYERYSKTKTLLYRDMPVNLKDFYIRTDLIINSKKVDGNEFIKLIERNKRIVVTGSAGCGKSTFCKSIFIELVEKPIGIFPIFIELRHLNNIEDKSLYSYILNEMIKNNPDFEKNQLDYALKLGKVLIILDGFDEVDNDHRNTIEKEILELSNNNNGIRLLVSSRIDNRFSSWNEFYNYAVQPLDEDKAINLIKKLEYDETIKDKFIIELENKLYASHETFASNPLLLTLMLLTFEQIAEIPNKMHLFYEQAFLTLFNKHDAFKSLYKRKSFTNLPVNEFKKILEIFCLYTFCERRYYFEVNDLIKYIKKSIDVSKINVNELDFLNDLLDSVCLIQRDGLGYTFTHRSFQEYFTASFLVNNSMVGKFKLFEKIFSINSGNIINSQDIVISMVQDMNLKLLEKEWIIPKIDLIVHDIKSVDGLNNNSELIIFSKFYSAITLTVDDGKKELAYAFGSYPNKISYFWYFILNLYSVDYIDFFSGMENIFEGNNHFKELLLEVVNENGDISLDEIERIDSYVRQLLKQSEILNLPKYYIEFLTQKALDLRKIHERQDGDILNLILG